MSKGAIKSDLECQSLAPEDGQSRVVRAVYNRAGGGLCLEARSGSKNKSWIYRYRLAGSAHKQTLGSYPRMSLAEARVAHTEAIGLVKQGIDPRQVAKQAKAANLEMPTLVECYRDWLSMRAKSKPIGPRTLRDYEGTFARHIEPAIGKTRVCDLSRAVLYEHFRRVDTAEGARKGLIVLNQCLDHAVLQGHIEINPARLLKPAMFGASMPPPRERWLTRDELRQLWAALEQATAGGGSVAAGGRGIAANVVLSQAVANCLRLITLTAVRRSEAVGMCWSHINGDRWTIPETKNGRAHVVTLCPPAMAILEQQRVLSNGPFVFESSSLPGQPITGDAVTRALERVRLKYLGELEPFSPHDLRRSAATGCVEYLDAPERLIELMLNHVPKDRLIRTYQVGQQAEKLRALFLRWGSFVADLVRPVEHQEPSNVVRMEFGRR
ncbi:MULTISPECIES: tyrosine-type recombinase/integrase [Aeromonas]|uniref:tyrosine-type recombinase/integrase n=1 Tax=Aeromonas TaxID=642 RepID=UPI0003AA1487|nr:MULTISPECIES: site-specific integrase [Aeromonas]QXC36174.1 integrase arm-type DNA-binding domain-containing protein [Aeromonas sp. FDAARGOS 1407]TNI44090.1 integrase [Aeromonas dhakensis]